MPRRQKPSPLAGTVPDPALIGPALIGPALLDWYDRHRRHLPWRSEPGERADPYRVWLSEIMLQQTTVATVGPYFGRFLARWPDIRALAAASLDDVLRQWAGLGYYARARNLHRCAQVVAHEHGGVFPDSEQALRALPGIGAYTAAAIAAIAFGRPANVVDGNVERVMARLHAVRAPLPGAKPVVAALAARLVPQERPGDHAQALMDLGATICRPRAPECPICPLRAACAAHGLGIAEALPARASKPGKPTRHAVAFALFRGDGAILMRRRAETGLLGGMMEVPSSDWLERLVDESEMLAAAPVAEDWTVLPGAVRHTFTHFHLEMRVAAARLRRPLRQRPHRLDGTFLAGSELEGAALPTLMRKIVAHARQHFDGIAPPASARRRA